MRRVLMSLAVLGLLAALPALLSPATAGARPSGTLTASTRTAVAGEPITFTGTIPTGVRRPLVLQRQLGSWLDLKRFTSDADGTFSVTAPLNGMHDNLYRVVAPRYHAGGRTFAALVTPTTSVTAVDQDVTLAYSVDTFVQRVLTSVAAPGLPVTATAATEPARPGRPITLQQRAADGSWTDVETETADADGVATFHMTAPLLGHAVYRALGEPWHGLSSFPSFPRYLWVTDQPPVLDSPQPAGGSSIVLNPQPGPVDAANTYKWGNAVENYGWEEGESITPTWTEDADGTGRVTNFVAMLSLDSGVQDGRYLDFGDVSSTLTRPGHAYGRWEMRARAPIFNQVGENYGVRLELVPAGSAPGYCGAQTITLGDFTGYDDRTVVGVSNGGSSWTRTIDHVWRNRENWHTYAVEVTPKRISWFIDAKVVATLKAPAAVSGVRLVPRLAMDAVPGVVMNHTRLTADWVRYFSLARPDAKPTAAPAPTKGTFSGSC